MIQLPETYFIMPKFKIYIIVDMVAKNLEIIIYIILKKIFKAKTSSIIEIFFNIAIATFVSTIFIIILDDIRFELYYLLT